MKKNSLVFLFITFVLSNAIFAQARVGFKIGLASSNIVETRVESTGDFTQFKSIITPQLSMVIDAPIGEFVSIRPELGFLQRGTKLNYNGQLYNYTFTYLEIPLNLAVGYSIKDAKIELYVGPAFGLGVSGYSSINSLGTTNENKDIVMGTQPETPEDNTLYFNDINFSLNYGMCYKFKRVMFQIGYNKGLTNMYPHYEDPDLEKLRGKYWLLKSSSIALGFTFFVNK